MWSLINAHKSGVKRCYTWNILIHGTFWYYFFKMSKYDFTLLYSGWGPFVQEKMLLNQILEKLGLWMKIWALSPVQVLKISVPIISEHQTTKLMYIKGKFTNQKLLLNFNIFIFFSNDVKIKLVFYDNKWCLALWKPLILKSILSWSANKLVIF